MSSYRLNLTIDNDFALILKHFKSQYPLSSDADIIRMVLGQQFVVSQNAQRKAWSDLLPELKLNKEDTTKLENAIESFEKEDKISFENSSDLITYLNN
jgi:allantoicase